MSFSILAVAVIVLYSAVAIAYVYRWRGTLRYASFSQYLRKSWPVFAPFNCLLYMATHRAARKPVLAATDLQQCALLRENWQVIRDEALALYATDVFDAARTPGSVGYYDVGFRTFYKRGWSRFYLKWYGTTHHSAQRLCPNTVALLSQVSTVRGAMFSLLPAGAELSLHSDPLACSLRYHLGLATPNSAQCQIVVDGTACSWHDGQDFVFDETYPHYASNATTQPRLILMCDIERPMNIAGRLFNLCYRLIARGTVVPNTAEDKRGVFSALFASVAPLKARSMRLREQRRGLYRLLKFMLNTSLLAVLLAMLFGVLALIETLAT